MPDCAAKLTGILLGTVVLALFACINHICFFVKNERWQYGIRDNVIWWDSPYWPRSAGFVLLDNVCKVRIRAGTGNLQVTLRDGSTQRIPWNAWPPAEEQLRDILTQHYPSVAIEFIERNEGSGISDVRSGPFRQKGPTAAASFSANRSSWPFRSPSRISAPAPPPNGHRRGRTVRAKCPAMRLPSSGRGAAHSTVSSRGWPWLSGQIRSSSRTRPKIRKTCPARMIGVPTVQRSRRPVPIDQPIRPRPQMEPVVPSHKASQASTASTRSPGARFFAALRSPLRLPGGSP